MKIIPALVKNFSKTLKNKTSEDMAAALGLLGFEAEVVSGKTEVINLEITPNHGDAMSHLGIARELQAYFSKDLKTTPKAITLKGGEKVLKLKDSDLLQVNINTDAVSQYHGIVFDGVEIKDSPDWLKDELLLLGIKPINNFVDLTNYLMELYGQPLHVFDADLVYDKKLTIRLSKKGERVVTLDNTEHTLPEGVIVIEDGKELIDLSGIQGGKNSQVGTKTKRVFLQSAIFDAKKVRVAGKKLNHRTDASVRYERGVDSAISLAVLEAFCDLASKKEFGSNKPSGKIIALSEEQIPVKVKFDSVKINQLLGIKIPKQKQEKYLNLLGFKIEDNTALAPSWRHDISIWQDLAEEVMRLEGLDSNVPAKNLKPIEASGEQSEWEWAECLKDSLLELNFSEIQTYSFISKKDLEIFKMRAVNPLVNPLNPDFKYPRPSLAPGIARTIAANPWFDPVQIFEVGHVFGESEQTSLAIGVAGRVKKIKDTVADFAQKTACDLDSLMKLGKTFELDQKTKDAYKIRKKYVAIFEILLSDLRKLKPRIPVEPEIKIPDMTYRPVSKFPPSTRDLSIIISNDVPFKQLHDYVLGFSELVENVILLDEFSHEKFGSGNKSITFRIFYSHTSLTLDQEKVDTLNNQIVTGLQKSLQAIIR